MKALINNHPYIIIFCLGCVSALGMAPVYAWPLTFFGYAYLTHTLIQSNGYKQLGVFSFLFFFGYHLTGLYWVSSSLFVEFDKWWWALPISFVGLPLLLSLFPAVCIAITSKISYARPIMIVLGLIISDIARGSLLTGFPWNLPIHSLVNTDVLSWALPQTGFWIGNSLVILLFTLPALFRQKRNRISFIAAVLMLFILPFKTPEKVNHWDKNISLIQANIPQHEKWDLQFIWRNFERYIDMSQQAVTNNEPQIIIWPETAISQNLLLNPFANEIFNNFLSSLPEKSVLITGYLNFKNDVAYNSLVIFNKAGEIIHQYDKHHLVPFGEYMPFGLDTITGFNNFESGEKPKKIREQNINMPALFPLICYESIFSSYTKDVSSKVVFLQITNDSWFGNTAGPYQHFDHARLRAIESQNPLIRLSGNGISAFINSNGQIHTSARLNKKLILNP